MKLRVVVLTEIISPYRIPVFNALASREEMDLHVIFLSETDSRLRQWRVYKDEIQFSYEVLPSHRFRAGKNNLLLNKGLWSSLNRFSPDSVICGGYNYAASWESLLWARHRQRCFLLWSESNSKDNRGGRRWRESLKEYFVRHCDAFVVPGKSSSEYLRTLGALEKDIFTAPNAVDNDFFAREAESVKQQAGEFRRQLGLPQRFILYVGRLVPDKGIFDLLEAYARLDRDLLWAWYLSETGSPGPN